MIWNLPLLAAGDWIGIVVFLVILIISAISQTVGNKKEVQQRPKPRPRPPVRPAQAGPRPQNPAGELEEFLRRAAGGQPAPRPQQPPPVPVARPVIAQPVVAEVTDELEVIETVAEHVGHSAGESRFPPRREPQQEPEDKVSQKFDHQMGQFIATPAQQVHEAALADSEDGETLREELPSTAAAGLAAMLASPASLRQAILLSEILERPEHRWS